MVTGRVRLGTRIAAGVVLAAVAAGCGGILGDDDDDKSDAADSGKTTAATSGSTAESTADETSAKEAQPPKVVARNAVMAIGGVPKLTYRITDDSLVRETITVWRGKKRLAIAVGKELTEAGRRTGVEPFTEAPWAKKAERLRWCVRGFDEHGNKSKAVCAVLRVVKELPPDTTAEDTGTSEDATSGSTAEDGSTTGAETTEDSGTGDGASSEDEASTGDSTEG